MVKKALLIGINYINSEYQLDGCINDIHNINKFLINYCGYLPENIRILTEKSDILPNKSNIIEQINWLIKDVEENDTLLFYYSGHGSYSKDKNKDESDKRDEQIIPLDVDEKGEISDDWLYSNFASKVPKNANLWCFFDCCHSGTALDLTYNCVSQCSYKKSKKKLKEIKKENFVYNKEEWTNKFKISEEKSKKLVGNVCEFSGCRDKQTSDDTFEENMNQGAFTFCLLKFLNNHLTEKDGKKQFDSGTIKLKDVLKEINAFLDAYDYKQNSQLSVGNEGDFEKYFDI